MSTRVPIVVIMGATGTGKSKLAIQIAKKFNGEIISADSMQVYQGLNIASNKVTKAERAEVPHHMLDICRSMDRFSALDFQHRTLNIIDDILKRRKLPIIVGGTNYYIESVLWESLTSGPAIDAEELVEKYYHVLSKPGLVDKWRTYESSVLPMLDKEIPSFQNNSCSNIISELESTAVPAPITIDGVNQLAEMIKALIGEFKECALEIASHLNINSSVYLRTFYRLPESSRGDQTAVEETSCQSLPESMSFNFVEVELALLNYYLYTCLRKVVEKLTNDNRSEDWQASEVCREFMFACWDGPAVATAVINEASVTRTDFNELVDEICAIASHSPSLLAKCHEAIHAVYENSKVIMELRLKRLRLLRIMDDNCMMEYMNDQLYQEMKLVDLKSTELIHPNNRRKVIRCLQIYFQQGIPYTKFIELQHHQKGGGGMFAPMRFPDACVLWLTCDQIILTKRLNDRVDEMMKEGLIEELEKFHEEYNLERLMHNIKKDYTKGIFQSIGLKEFHYYLMLSPERKSSPEGQEALRRGIHHLKMATTRYSRVQYRNVYNHFIEVPREKTVPPVFELDCTNLEEWNEKVENVALDIVGAYLRGEDLKQLKYTPVPIEKPDASRFQDGKFTCKICNRVFIGQFQWQSHYTSKGHRKQLYQTKVKEFQKKIAALGPSLEKESDDSVEYGDIFELFS